ncbi:DUF6973 domain-containing protein [Nocardia stercoris]|uniref:DUF6973 domain-containing protein n=1 Tax=Nocardia stercoris TaxID=2483361 RepID=UPI000EFA3AB5|nr:hypothetical protein [Nocardia stercoris]
MPPTKSQIRKWNVEPLAAQALEWSNASKAATTEYNSISRQLADSPGFWRGPAGDAMRDRGTQGAMASLSKVVAGLDKGVTATTNMVQSLVDAKTAAVGAIAAVEESCFIVGEDGTVGYDKSTIAWLVNAGYKQIAASQMLLLHLAKIHESDIKAKLRAAADAAEAARTAIDNVFADVPIPLNKQMDWIEREYQVDSDSTGMTNWPTGLKATLMGVVGKDPLPITVAEAQMLDDLSLVDQIKFYRIMQDAEDSAKAAFPPQNGQTDEDNHTDAYRHAYWNARMTQVFGEDWTKEYTTKHEGRDDNAAVREAMDLHNNDIGRQIGLANPDADPDELRKIVRNAVDNGDTVMINKDFHLSPTNQVAQGQGALSVDFNNSGPQHRPGVPAPNNNPSTK